MSKKNTIAFVIAMAAFAAAVLFFFPEDRPPAPTEPPARATLPPYVLPSPRAPQAGEINYAGPMEIGFSLIFDGSWQAHVMLFTNPWDGAPTVTYLINWSNRPVADIRLFTTNEYRHLFALGDFAGYSHVLDENETHVLLLAIYPIDETPPDAAHERMALFIGELIERNYTFQWFQEPFVRILRNPRPFPTDQGWDYLREINRRYILPLTVSGDVAELWDAETRWPHPLRAEQDGDLLHVTVGIGEYAVFNLSQLEEQYVITIRLEEDGGFKYLSYAEIPP